MSLKAVVLAAGQGTRMKSNTAKVLHYLGGKRILGHVVDGVLNAGARDITIVVGRQRKEVENLFKGPNINFVVQEQQLGTGHAMMQAAGSLSGFDGDVLVTCGDVPLILPETYGKLAEVHEKEGNSLTVLTSVFNDPGTYGRIIRNAENKVTGIIEAKDATSEELAVREINTGIYMFRVPPMLAALEELSTDNAQGEYYLTDLVRIFIDKGLKVAALAAADPAEVTGINSRADLATASAELNRRTIRRLMESGVTIVNPSSTWIESSVQAERDTIIAPFCVIEGSTFLGEGTSIGPFSRLKDVETGKNVTIEGHVNLEGTVIEEGVKVLPGVNIPGFRR
jgi:bifunctional UDP-N-acetylglucosamine pyrophosphorylase/glucosamine-1-phosphate N-acetyltransferase